MTLRQFRSTASMAIAALLFGVGGAYAATQTVTATIKFFTDITITPVTPPNFGYVQAGVTGIYTLSTAGVVTPSGVGVLEGGTPVAGDYLIKGSNSQAINIKTGSYVPSTNTTLSAATCLYGAGVETPCDAGINVAFPTAAGTHVKVGVKATTLAGSTDGLTETPSLTLTVVYQ